MIVIYFFHYPSTAPFSPFFLLSSPFFSISHPLLLSLPFPLRRQLSSVEQQLFASRQVRKLRPVMATKSFSPLSPVLKKISHSQEQLMQQQGTTEQDRIK